MKQTETLAKTGHSQVTCQIVKIITIIRTELPTSALSLKIITVLYS